jgi:hypothetical protein
LAKSDVVFEAAWRNCQWDLPCDSHPCGPQENVFSALKAISSSHLENADALIDHALLQLFESIDSGRQNTNRLAMQCSRTLVEIGECCAVQSVDELRRCVGRWQERSSLDERPFRDEEQVFAARLSLLQILYSRPPPFNELPNKGILLVINQLTRSVAWRISGRLELSITSIRQTRPEDQLVSARVQRSLSLAACISGLR